MKNKEIRYVEPPWTYSPKEINEWINATYGGHKCKKANVEKHKKWLKNVEIDIDLNVEKEIKKSKNIILKLVGYEKVEEHFELLPTADIISRALRKAGYKKIKVNKMDAKKSILIHASNDGNATIKIRKAHTKKHHSIEIKIDKIKEKNFQKFLIYIRKRLEGTFTLLPLLLLLLLNP